MAQCELCGKHTHIGGKVKQVRSGLFSHTKREIKPNLQKASVVIGGREKRVTACARCIRSANRIRQ